MARGRIASRPMTFRPLLLAALLALAPAAHADALADLKAALSRLQGGAPVKGQVELVAWRKSGDGADATEWRAKAAAGLEDGPRGLNVLYGRELLGRLDEERRAKSADPQAKTPTVDAMAEFQVTDLQPLSAAAVTLQRAIERATFVGEKASTWNGRPARLLSFSRSIDSLAARDRKYVKEFEAGLEVWVAADGTPLASRRHEKAAGRAFVVVSFDSFDEEDTTYAVASDRLVATKREAHRRSSGAGEKDERTVTTTVAWGA